MAKSVHTPKKKKVIPLKDEDGKPVKSKATGNIITEGSLDDPDLHDGQAWREGKAIGVNDSTDIEEG